MWDLDYNTFFEDCDEVFKDFLAKYGFKDAGGDEEEYEKYYKSEHWILEINMLANFPHIGVSLIFKNLKGESIEADILERALEINDKKSNEVYEKYLTMNTLKTYKRKMFYVCENLETFYKPILTGEFTYEDYKKFEASMGNNDTTNTLV